MFVERIVDGRKRPVDLDGLIDAGLTAVGDTEVSLIAFDKTSGTRLWSYTRPATAPSWPFHCLLPVDGAPWADTHPAMIKLQ